MTYANYLLCQIRFPDAHWHDGLRVAGNDEMNLRVCSLIIHIPSFVFMLNVDSVSLGVTHMKILRVCLLADSSVHL